MKGNTNLLEYQWAARSLVLSRTRLEPFCKLFSLRQEKNINKICVCNNLRLINKNIFKDRESLPLFNNLIEWLQDIKYFITLDLR